MPCPFKEQLKKEDISERNDKKDKRPDPAPGQEPIALCVNCRFHLCFAHRCLQKLYYPIVKFG